MKFSILHYQGRILDPNDRRKAEKEWEVYLTMKEKNRPKPSNEEAFKKYQKELVDKQQSIKERYKFEDEWEVDTMEQLLEKIEYFGAVSVSKEENGNYIYLYDLPPEEKNDERTDKGADSEEDSETQDSETPKE